MQRQIDSTGMSGTGRVAEGCQFPNGWCALTWNSPFVTVGAYPNIEVVVHLHGHGGNTKVVWDDPPNYVAIEPEGVGART